ncbi:MAG: CehA/McbA family metallohydrolase [Myxococcota bacterium]
MRAGGRRTGGGARRAAARAVAAALACAVAQLAACGDAPGDGAPERADGAEAASGARDAAPSGRAPADSDLSPTARPETEAELRADLEAARHPGDGGGRAWLVSLERIPAPAPGVPGADGPAPAAPIRAASIPASGRARIRIAYEVGPHGIAPGGALYVQSSPFWDWEPAQADVPALGGYATAETAADGVALEPHTYGGGLVAFVVRGRALAAGARVDVALGAGPSGIAVDRYAERESRVWLQVDADGDGTRGVVASSPAIAVHAGPPAILVVRAPTTAHPGDEVDVHVALLDAQGNAAPVFEGSAEIAFEPQTVLALPERAAIAPDAGGAVRLAARTVGAGVARLRARARLADGRELESAAEPLVVVPGAPRVLWADLHGHSAFSDGTGTPEDYFRYARDVAALDVAALTDHDHWGMRFLDASPDLWQRIRAAVADANEPGRFVALLGYEWTSWLYGHRHVLHFADDGPLLSSLDAERRTETPEQLWSALRGLPALTFAHHSAGGPIATAWSHAPDPVLEPVTEIVSVHGSSEAPDSPRPIYAPADGNWVRDALARGYALGFVGSGDSHDGHPGLAQIASPGRTNGVAAIFAEERTREAVLAALRARRTYATNGPRLFLRATLDGVYEMGERVAASDAPTHALAIRVAAQAPIAFVDVVRNGEIAMRLDGEGALDWSRAGDVPRLRPGETLYVRVVQENDGAAWSSPFFGPLDAPDADE